MNKDTLLLYVDAIPMYSQISGNLDVDRISVGIRTAQRNELKRILGIDLYNKILEDFKNDALTGIYKTIYDEFVIDMLVNYSAYYIVLFNSLRIDNGGNFYYEPDNARSVDIEDTEKLANRFSKMGAAVELQYYKWLKSNKVPEVKGSGSCDSKGNSYKLNWFLD